MWGPDQDPSPKPYTSHYIRPSVYTEAGAQACSRPRSHSPRMAVRGRGPGLLQRLRALAAASPVAGARCLSDGAPSAVGGRLPADGRTLQDFLRQGQAEESAGSSAEAGQGTGEHTAAAAAAASPPPQPATAPSSEPAQQRTAFVETYGCEWRRLAAAQLVCCCLVADSRWCGEARITALFLAPVSRRRQPVSAGLSTQFPTHHFPAGQMNVNDSEVVAAVLREAGYGQAEAAHAADVVLLNTCAIRENAEAKVGVGARVLHASWVDLIRGLLLSVHTCLGECGRPSRRARLCRDCLRCRASAAGTPCQNRAGPTACLRRSGSAWATSKT